MALQKQSINVNFAQGLDLKTDSKQVDMSKFLGLSNAVFGSGGALNKRNGFGDLTTLPNSAGTTITTLNDNLVATGSILQAYSMSTQSWLNRGTIQPVAIDTQPLVRNSTSQVSPDIAISESGLVCTVYVDSGIAYYQVTDNRTGQMVVSRTALPSTATNPRVFQLGRYFIITFGATVSGSPHLRYMAIPLTMPASPLAATDISVQISAITGAYDAYVSGNNLFIALNGSDGGGALRIHRLSSSLIVSAATVVAGRRADLLSVTTDDTISPQTVWVSWWDTTANHGYTMQLTNTLVQTLAPTQIITATDSCQITSKAKNGTVFVAYQVINTYSYNSVRTDYINTVSCTSTGTVSSTVTILRGVGLQSKLFSDNSGTLYMLAVQQSAFQNTYFLIDYSGNVVAKLAYSNGGGYASSFVLSNVIALDDNYYVSYLFKDLLVSANKFTGADTAGGIYTQTGINMAKLAINTSAQYSAEIAGSLHLTGGLLWQYDSVKPVELGFNIWPEDIEVNTSTTGGLLTAQQYYYKVTYEWTDAQGQLHRSAPSLAAGIVTTGATSSNTLEIPTYRQTYKTGQNPVRIVVYRWSTAQQNYFQVSSITSPTLNNTAVDSVTYVDILADDAILGNTLLYTTGDVVENIAPPSASVSTLYKSRLMLVDSENKNLIWYSKQVIQSTPIEMSDLFTIYVAPTAGAQGSTGDITALSAMDDKLIIFKNDAIYYITGTGPDNTGANNDFSEPTYITGTVGCIEPKSIVFMPLGIMFQSDKGIWLLGRDLSTKYIGADVETFNSSPIVAALAIPGTNEVRISLKSGEVLMYDYYYNQWGTFTNIPATSATLYQGRHTYLNSLGQIRQETPGLYIDGSSPVLVSFTTAWIKLTGLQGYQRAYFFYLLSEYISPYKMNIQISYDYKVAVSQTVVLTPENISSTWGSDALWGSGSTWGGSDSIDQRRVFLDKQKCQSVQISLTEIFDSSQGVAAGAGFSMSGINFIIGGKDIKPKVSAGQNAG